MRARRPRETQEPPLLIERRAWPLETWEPAPPLPKVQLWRGYWVCPYVPLMLPRYGDTDAVERAWNIYDAKSWYIPETRRLEILEDQIKPHLDRWRDIIRVDRTAIFARRIQEARQRKDGLVIGIAGPKGSGKSRFGQMVVTRVVDTRPHVIWEYKDLKGKIASLPSDESLAIQVDEDLTATGTDSGVLKTHVDNAAQTSRKADLWLICTGVNLDFEGWGNTLDLRLEPWGYNEYFYATRFAMFSRRNNLLGLGAIQRKHLPEDPVYYYDEPGIWAEYLARAKDYSRRTLMNRGVNTGADRVAQAEARDRFFDFVTDTYGRSPPSAAELEFDYIDLGLPSDSVGFMRRVVAKVLGDLKREQRRGGEGGTTGSGTFSLGWAGLRSAIYDLGIAHGASPNDAEKASIWYVPDWPSRSESQVAEEYGIGRDAIQKAKSRGFADISETEWGDVAERWLASHIDSPTTTAGGRSGRADILLQPAGADEIAVNVKLCFERAFRRHAETTPEDRHTPRAACALVMARRLEVRLFAITGPETHLNDRAGRLCAPEEVEAGILTLIDSQDEKGSPSAGGGE